MVKKLSQSILLLALISVLAVVLTILGIGFMMIMNTPFIHCILFGTMIYAIYDFLFGK